MGWLHYAVDFVVSGAIPVALPKASNIQSEVRQSLIVIIDAQGNIYFNSTPVSLVGLREHLARMDRSAPIQVRADRDITIQACVDVLDLFFRRGIQKSKSPDGKAGLKRWQELTR